MPLDASHQLVIVLSVFFDGITAQASNVVLNNINVGSKHKDKYQSISVREKLEYY